MRGVTCRYGNEAKVAGKAGEQRGAVGDKGKEKGDKLRKRVNEENGKSGRVVL